MAFTSRHFLTTHPSPGSPVHPACTPLRDLLQGCVVDPAIPPRPTLLSIRHFPSPAHAAALGQLCGALGQDCWYGGKLLGNNFCPLFSGATGLVSATPCSYKAYPVCVFPVQQQAAAALNGLQGLLG